MRIAIDARELCGQRTGVGRYLAELLTAWNDLPGAAAHEFVLCAPESVADLAVPQLRLTTTIAAGRGTRWEQLTFPRLVARSRANVVFAPAYTAPLRSRVPTVVTIHDVSFAAHPEWFHWREGWRRRILTRMSAGRAARILTVSDFSKREIVKYLGVPADKIEVIYSGVTGVGAAAPVRPRGPSAATILFVGSILNRRHVPELIEGFTRLAGHHAHARLDIVGDNRTSPYIDVQEVVRRSPARDRIHVRDYVSDTELASLYQQATACAFLSGYEGFGFTPLEALKAGAPIVVLDTEVAREIYGPAAHYIARPEPDLVAAALERVLFDDSERQRIGDAAGTVLERYVWRECAQRTLQMLLTCGA